MYPCMYILSSICIHDDVQYYIYVDILDIMAICTYKYMYVHIIYVHTYKISIYIYMYIYYTYNIYIYICTFPSVLPSFLPSFLLPTSPLSSFRPSSTFLPSFLESAADAHVPFLPSVRPSFLPTSPPFFFSSFLYRPSFLPSFLLPSADCVRSLHICMKKP